MLFLLKTFSKVFKEPLHSLRILLSRDLNTGIFFLRVRPRLMTKGGERTDHLSICDQRKLYLKNGIQIDKHKRVGLAINLRSLMRRRHREESIPFVTPLSLKSKEEIHTLESKFGGI